MSRSAPDLTIPVGVVVERRPATSPWLDHVWQAVAVLPGVPETVPRQGYEPLTIEEMINLVAEYRLALRDGRLLADMIDPKHPPE